MLPTVDHEGNPGIYGSPHYVHVEEKAGAWRALVPDMPACVGRGKSKEEAYSSLLDSVRGYLRKRAESPVAE